MDRTADHRRDESSEALLGETGSGASDSRCALTTRSIAVEFTAKRRGNIRVPRTNSGAFPTVPDSHRYTESLVSHAHLKALHGRVGSTITKV